MKIFCVGRNYVDHIHELGNQVPENMVIFMKPNTAVHLADKPWKLPNFSNEIHYECEIVLKVAKNGKYIRKEDAEDYFEEIGLGIDFTARDIQAKHKEKGLPWEIAKAFDHSAVVGRFIPKSTVDLSNIQFQLYQNEAIVQNGNSNCMIHSFKEMISEISQFFTIESGDLIFSGTPAGVGKISSRDHYRGVLENKELFSLKIQ